MVKENENKGSEPFWVDKAGLWCLSPGDDSPVWLSAPLSVIGRSRNNIGEGHGLLVAWNDPDGKRKEWVMPLEMLADDGKEMRKGLLNRGLRMATSLKARRRFLAWIANQRPKKTWIVTRDQGWNGHSYVLPDGVIGFSQDPIILEGWDSEKEEIQVSGELEEWIENVSLPCLGHRKLMISLIAAFAGPMMYWTSEENFGLHFHGGSSIGKTTTLYVAQSVWGGPRGLQRWRSTANALETVASGRNDRLLCLDEIAQLDPRMAGEVAYMLGNGKGKHRALKDGSKAKEKSWRLVYLSSGEISLSEFVETNGGIMRGGMGVRQIDIRAEEGENGILGKMEGDEKPADFISRLVGSTRFLFGTAGRAFAFEVSKDPHEHVDFVESYRTKFLEIFEKDIKNGQSRRVCEKFGFLCGVGELAIKMKLTGWGQGVAALATISLFEEWLELRDGGQTHEEIKAVKQVREFISRHGDSRFEAIRGQELQTRDRAGFWRNTDDKEREFLFYPEIWTNEVCKGLSAQEVAKILHSNGWLKKGDGKNLASKERIPYVNNPCRMYVVKSAIMEEPSRSDKMVNI